MSEDNKHQTNRSLELCKRVVTTESFIAEAKEIYGDRYDYSKVVYKNREHKVTIVCPIHGDFQIYAREHLDGKGCPKCEKGEKFLVRLKEKFGDKFVLDDFVYKSSTSPVTLICPAHGAFSRLPHQIINSKYGCPECGNEVQRKLKEESHNNAEVKKEEKRKEREELEAKRLNEFLEEREECKKRRELALKDFQTGKKSEYFYSPFYIYQQIVDEHIDDIRYNAKWREPLRAPYRLTDEEARKQKRYIEGDVFYRYPNEAPEDYIKKEFSKVCEFYDGTIEEFLSHRNCVIIFEGNDLIILDRTYEHGLESQGLSNKKESTNVIPTSFVSIDFETLYSQRISICSIGMVKYIDGEIVDRYYSLIRPPFDYPGKSGKEMTWVHGISKEMLVNEKTFAELLPDIEKFVDSLPLVAHNSSVEKCCIRDTCAYYGIETNLDFENILDTLPLSKEAEAKLDIKAEGQGTHSLDVVCSRFKIKVLNHHNALEDAEMCGNLMVVFHKILVDNESLEVIDKKETPPSIPVEETIPSIPLMDAVPSIPTEEKVPNIPTNEQDSELNKEKTNTILSNTKQPSKGGCLGFILFITLLILIVL